MRDHTKLRACALADEVAFLTYRETKKFPQDEREGLTSQMRRVAVTVAGAFIRS